MKIFLLIVAVSLGAFAQEHKVGVNRFVPLKYPPISQAARVQGKVVLMLKMRPDGEVDEVEVLSGHPMLKQAAVDSLKQWRFVCIDCAFEEPFEQKVTVSYKLREESECSYDSNVRYEYRFPDYVSVETGPVALCQPTFKISKPNPFRRWFRRKAG